MSIVNQQNVLWLEPQLIDNDIEMIKTAFVSQVSLASSDSNISTLLLSMLTNSSATALAFSNEKSFLVLQWFVRIIGCLLIIIGGIGNTLSALTLSRKKLRTQATSIYLIALALSDLGKTRKFM